jgi:hypothetical protein
MHFKEVCFIIQTLANNSVAWVIGRTNAIVSGYDVLTMVGNGPSKDGITGAIAPVFLQF